MPGDVLFDTVQVNLFVPDGADEATTDAARSALDDPTFLTAVRDAVRRFLATIPALAALAVTVEW